MKIGTRLHVGFGVMLCMLVGVAALGIVGIGHANEDLKHIVDINGYNMSLLHEMSVATHVVARVERTIALLDDDEQRGKVEYQKIEAARLAYDTAFGKLAQLPLDQAGKSLVSKIKKIKQLPARATTGFL